MKKRITYIILAIALILYLVFGHIYHIYIPCPIHYITGYYCPGCGLTRMLFSILKLDFYQAFRYNPFVFILFFPSVVLYINHIYSKYKNKTSWYNKIPVSVFYIILVMVIIYGVLRNIYPILAPTVVR